MVAVVTGGGLGLNLGSGSVLGGAGVGGSAAFGRQSDRVYVNAASGNLVLQARDELLTGRGPDAAGLRTYNSLGSFVDDNGDNWLPGLVRKAWLASGTANTANSTAIRRDEDGSEAVFTWDAGRSRYISFDGAGAYDSLSFDAGNGNWTFTDGSSRIVEVYGASGRLLSSTDANGQTLSFTYNAAGLLQSATTPAGEVTWYDYSGTQLTQLRTVTRSSDGASLDRTLTRVRYGYDTSNRLATVTVDLSPEDNTVTDGRVFTTTYTYDGASKRVAGITQSDGAKLGFTYDASARLQTATDALGGTTSFAYDAANRATTVTDPLGQATVYRYDTVGRLLSITSPAVNGVSSVTRYDYNANGDVIRLTDAEGRAVNVDFDAWGNAIRQTDAAGNVVRSQYNAQNQLTAQTVATAGEPASTTAASRYVYDTSGTRLRFSLSAEGRVAENRYDGYGQPIATIQYASAAYATAGLPWTSVPSEADLTAWANAQDRSKTQRTDFAYDWRGQLTRSTRYDSVDASGNGQGAAVTQYIYDAAGQLIKTVDARSGVTQTTYDGLGRALTTTNALNQISVNSYTDDASAGATVKTTAFNGLVTTTTFDKLARAVSVVQADTPGNKLGEAKSFFDADSRLRMTQDALGNRQWFLYDAADRQVSQINALGQLTETVYNKAGQVTQTVSYANLVNLSALVDGNGQPTNVSLAQVRPAASTGDIQRWNAYDSAGRLAKTVSPLGEVTEFTYDASNRLLLTRRYASAIGTAALGSTPAPGAIAPPASSQDQLLRSFYDNDGLTLGSLDATGSLSETQYDAAGRKTASIQRTQFASGGQVNQATSAATTLAQVRPADSANDRKALNFYNARGQLVAQLDGEGDFSETRYDATGNVSQTFRYSLKATGFNTASLLSSVRTAAGAVQTSTAYEYDLLNRVLKQRVDPSGLNLTTTSAYDDANGQLFVTNPNGITSKTQLDAKGRATAATVDPTGLALTTKTSYDANGRVSTSTDAKGIVTLFTYDQLNRKASQTLDPAGLNLTTTYSYDAQGNLARTIDPLGRHTRYVYDQDGRLQYELDAEYGLTEYRYDATGNRVQSIRYLEQQKGIQTFNVGSSALISNSFAWVTPNVAKDQTTRYAYDAAGRQVYSVDAAGSVTQYEYDAAGQVVAKRELANTMPSGGAIKLFNTDGQWHGMSNFTPGTFKAGDVVTATVRFKAPPNLRGEMFLGDAAGPDPYDNSISNAIQGNDGWQTLTLTWKMKHDDVMSVFIYNQLASPDGAVVYDNLRVSSEMRGEVLVEDFQNADVASLSAKGWGFGVTTQATVGGQAQVGTQAQFASFLATLADPTRDRVTRYAYDAAGRQVYSVDAAGSVTQYEYDAAGQVVAKRELANTMPSGGAIKLFNTDGQWHGMSNFTPGTFKAGDVVTATVRFKAPPNLRGEMFLGDAAGPDPYDNSISNAIQGNDGWQTLTLSWKMKHDDVMSVFLYNQIGSADGAVVYDNLRLSSEMRGEVLVEDFQNADVASLSAKGWGFGVTTQATVGGQAQVGTQAQFASFLATLADPTRDRVTRYAYDAAGRQVYSVDAAGSVTQYEYDAAGQVVAKRELANTMPSGGAIKLFNTDGQWHGMSNFTPGTFKAGDVVTATVRFKAPPNLRGEMFLGDAAGPDPYDNSISNAIQGNDGWQTLTLSWKMKHDDVMSVFLYNQIGSADGAVVYDNLRLSSEMRGEVLVEDFQNADVASLSAKGWGFGVTTQATVGGQAQVGTQAQFASFLATLADPTRDRVTRYAYDAAGRQVYSVDAAGSVTQYEYDAAGQVVAKRELANTMPSGGAIKLFNTDGQWHGMSNFTPGTFKAGDVVTATVRFKAPPNLRGEMFLGDAAGPDPYDNSISNAIQGNDGWQTLTLSWKMKHDDVMSVFLYNQLASPDGAVVYDNLRLSSEMRGEVLVEDFQNADVASLSAKGWGFGVTTQATVGGQAQVGTQAQFASFLATLADPTRDRVTRYAYDAAGRQVYSVDAAGSVTQYEYDAAGQVVAKRELANTMPSGGAIKLFNTDGQWHGMSNFTPGTFKAGDVVTATVRFKAPPNLRGEMFLGDAAGPDPYDNSISNAIQGNDGWQTLTLTWKMKHDDVMSVFIYNQLASPDGAVVYDNLRVSSEMRGEVLVEDFQNADVASLSAKGWGFGVTTQATVGGQAQVGTQAQFASFLATLADPTRDRVTRYAYDAAGRQVYSVDAAGSVTQYEYDAAGQVVAKRELANTMPSGGAIKLFNTDGQWHGMSNFTPGTFKAGDVVTATVRFKAPPNLRGEMFLGDAAGPDPYDNSISNAIQGNDGWQTLTLSWKMKHDDVMSVFLYNQIGSADGAVVYDNLRLSSEMRGEVLVEDFQNADVASLSAKGWGFGVTTQATVGGQAQVGTQAQFASFLATLSDPARDRVTRYVYDLDGRPVYTQDALGGIVKSRYDTLGRVIEQIGYSHRLSTGIAATVVTFDAAVLTDVAYDHRTRTVYDADGRARFVIQLADGANNRGVVTETVYDAFGRAARTIQYADTIAYSAVTDGATEGAVRALLPASTGAAPLTARETLYTYDAAGRLIHTAASQGTQGSNKYFSLTERRYDAFGQLAEQVAYANTAVLSDLPTSATVTQVAARVVANPTSDRRTRYTVDADGRVLSTTDGEGYVERTVYDAFGRKVQFTNKNGATTDYQYDAAGRLVQELGAAINVYAADASLNVTLLGNAQQRVATRYAYDAFGNLVSRTEATGIAGQERTTRYSYDALGRQTSTTFEAVAVYDAASDTTGAPAPLSTQTAYDAFGQAVINRDVSGKYSYKTYDQLGRLVNEVDALHNATHHFYSDLVGQFSGITRLDAAATFADGLGVGPDAVNAAVNAVAASGTPRSMANYFDQLGRTVTSYDKYSQADMSGVAYSFDATLGGGGNWISNISSMYDAFGSLVRRTELLDRTQYRQATTQYGYDLQGQLIRQVDAEGYVTDHHRNAFGEDDRVTQFASAVDPNGSVWAAPAALTAQAGNAAGFDRVTTFAYDRRGQQVLQSQAGLLAGRTTGSNGVVAVYGHLDTRLSADGVGNVTATTSTFLADDGSFVQSGASLNTTYDALGRAVKVVDASGRTTTTQYDAVGNALKTTRHANANPGGTDAPTASADDLVTRQRFDALGHVLQRRDALGNDTFFAVDAAGHVGKQWTPYHDADGGTHTAVQRFVFDAAGRQTHTLTLMRLGAVEAYSDDTAVYNAFGEITAKLRDGVRYAYYDYDTAGRVWRTNADDGVDKVYLYDLQGNVSSVITSATLDLTAYASASAVPTTLAGGVRRTINKVDRRGKLLEQSNLGATHLDGSTTAQLTRQTLDAWGNVLSVTTSAGGARAATTTYRYNAANQVIEEAKPTHLYAQDYQAGGALVSGRPVFRTYYDAWGRTVAATDARGFTATNTYLATGELQAETHADGGTIIHNYDNFGREIRRSNASANAGQANARVERFYWDKLGHLTSRTVDGRLLYHPDGAATSFASFSYAVATYSLGSASYDELGNRITATSGDDAKLKGVVQKSYFDGAGRLIQSSDPLKTTRYEYDAAGHKTAETDSLNQRSTWSYKANGQLDTHTDIGGATTRYEYDRAGGLTRQSNGRGQDLRTTYYDDGRVKGLTDAWADSASIYDYDSDGNRTVDRFAGGVSGTPKTYRNASMTYDALGRLATLSDSGYQLSLQYDVDGNRYRVQGSYDDRDTTPRADANNMDIESYDPDGLSQRKVDLTYTYDAANRVAGTRTLDYIGTTETYRWEYFGYDKDGNRTTDEQRFLVGSTAAGTVNGRLVEYTYDFANRVSEVFVTTKTANGSGGDVAGNRRDHRKNIYATGAGFTQEWQWANGYAADSFSYTDANPDRVMTTETWSNAGGNLTQVVSRQKLLSNANWYLTSNQTSAYDAAGNLKSMHVDGYQDQSTSLASSLDYKYTYLKMDGYLQRGSTVTGTQWNGASMASVGSVTTTQDYDVNGRLVGTYDNNSANNTAEQYLVNDNAGHIVLKARFTAAAALGAHVQTGTWDPNAGVNGTTGGSNVPARQVAPSLVATNTTSVVLERLRYANDQVVGSSNDTYAKRFIKTKDTSGYFDRTTTSSSFDAGFGAAQVNTSATSGMQYTWRNGDSLRALAQTFYGDGNLWYVIAEANGYGDDAAPAVGDLLRIPNVTRSSNTANSFAVYDAGKIIGNTNPDPIAPAPPPPPPGAGGCGGLGMILVIAVAVVATIVTAGAAALAMAGTLGSTFAAGGIGAVMTAGSAALAGGSLAAAAIGGAVGSIVSQGVGIAIGVQDKFSWKQVGLSAVGSAVTAGMGSALQGTALGAQISGMGYYGTAIKAAAGNAITQGVAVATGLQDKFSWRSVAVSAIAAPAAQAASTAMAGAINGIFDGSGLLQKTADGMVRGVVSQGVRMLVTHSGKMDYGAIAADAFGNAVGNSIVEEAQRTTETEAALASVAKLGAGGDPLRQKLAAIAGDTSISATDRMRQINALVDGAGGQQLSGAFGLDVSTGSAAPTGRRTALFTPEDATVAAPAGGVGASVRLALQGEQSSAVQQLSQVLSAARAGYAERQQIEDQLFSDEPAFNRALIFLGAATSHAADGVKGLANLLMMGGTAAANGAALVATQAIGLAREIASGDIKALTARANQAVDGIEGLGDSLQGKLEGLRTIAAFATNPAVASQLGGFLKGIASDTTATGWLLGGARFLGELATAAFTGGTASVGTVAGAVGGALMPTAFGGTVARGAMAFDVAMERFGQLAAMYRSAGEALQVVAGVGSGVSDRVLMQAHMLAMTAPMAERSGVLYGHIRMAEQGWERVADFKLPGNQGVDAAYRRLSESGVVEYAVLEAKSGRAGVRSLGEAGGFQQGTQDYIRNRLDALLKIESTPAATRNIAAQFLQANRSGDLQSFVSFANQGRSGGSLLQLPGGTISSLRDATTIPFKPVFGGI